MGSLIIDPKDIPNPSLIYQTPTPFLSLKETKTVKIKTENSVH